MTPKFTVLFQSEVNNMNICCNCMNLSNGISTFPALAKHKVESANH